MRLIVAVWLVLSVGMVACADIAVADLDWKETTAPDSGPPDLLSAPDVPGPELIFDLSPELRPREVADGGVAECSGFQDCDDDNQCTFDFCDAASRCVHKAIDGSCDDGDPCTIGEFCQTGECLPEIVLDCDDSNPCTKDVCKDDGCYHGNLEGPCDDGDPCTLGDYCKVGSCQGGVGKLSCDDSNSCTSDGCEAFVGCRFDPMAGLCNDQDKCTDQDHCQDGQCVGTPLSCDDGNPCTKDQCSDGQCDHLSTPMAVCDDLDACTQQDTCDGDGQCSGQPIDCDDGNVCTLSSCDPASGTCLHAPAPGPCQDDSPCTIDDVCHEGICVGQPMDCDDDNLCTADQCHSETGECVHVPLTGECDDLNLCTVGDECVEGLCVPGAGFPDCQDGNPCTGDTCDPNAGCVNDVLWGWPCDDGDGCTTNDTCTLAAVCTGESMVCDDEDPCTVDNCDPVTAACLFVPAPGVGCDDGDVCTKKDSCQADGSCLGEAKSCDDLDPCTNDSCQAGVGCVNTPIDPCDG